MEGRGVGKEKVTDVSKGEAHHEELLSLRKEEEVEGEDEVGIAAEVPTHQPMVPKPWVQHTRCG